MKAFHRSNAHDVMKSLPTEAQSRIRQWIRSDDRDPVIRRANNVTQLKILAVYTGFVLAMVAYVATGGHWVAASLSVAALGLVLFPLLCAYMHSHAHLKVGNGPVRNWLLDHGISLLYSLPQTGYKYGHAAHHRYDNDFDLRGYPKDLQSTYLFSRNGQPGNMWVWCAFFIVVYQHVVHLFHTLNAPKRRELLWFTLEYLTIGALHVGLYWLSSGFYLTVYLPSLFLGWTVVAVNLFMMHDVDLHHSRVHHSLNTRNWLYNFMAENVGYHMEHSLYPSLHPVYLQEVSGLIHPPEEQVIDTQYTTEALRRLIAGRAKTKDAGVRSAAVEAA